MIPAALGRFPPRTQAGLGRKIAFEQTLPDVA